MEQGRTRWVKGGSHGIVVAVRVEASQEMEPSTPHPFVSSLFQGSQDDAGVVALLMQTSRLSQQRPRRASAPPAPVHSARNGSGRGRECLLAPHRHCSWRAWEWRYPAPKSDAWDRFTWIGFTSSPSRNIRLCLQERCKIRDIWTGRELVMALRKWKRFVATFGVLPVRCSPYQIHQTVDVKDMVSADPQFCLTFPKCEHQEFYLKVVARDAG